MVSPRSANSKCYFDAILASVGPTHAATIVGLSLQPLPRLFGMLCTLHMPTNIKQESLEQKFRTPRGAIAALVKVVGALMLGDLALGKIVSVVVGIAVEVKFPLLRRNMAIRVAMGWRGAVEAGCGAELDDSDSSGVGLKVVAFTAFAVGCTSTCVVSGSTAQRATLVWTSNCSSCAPIFMGRGGFQLADIGQGLSKGMAERWLLCQPNGICLGNDPSKPGALILSGLVLLFVECGVNRAVGIFHLISGYCLSYDVD
ncbi:hypothetical protein HAX54_010162 [Datura stramonium]|uniref:Uncharacterized protein n=1 Tax=Datura stramonium TaxID=4076 RepID=A0ABS8TFX4_DATST|nr:hypothetical protein [Datura stramonium]